MKSQAAELPFSFRHLTFAGGLRAAALRDPAKIAYAQGDRTRSYGVLVARMDRITTLLLGELGLRPGDHGAIIARNSIEYMEIAFGASQAGIPLATINPRLSPQEIVAIADDADARVLFVDTDCADVLRDCRFATATRVVVIGEALEILLARVQPFAVPPAVPEWADFTIPYTSGTTGRPKGVQVSHRSRVLTLFGMAAEYGCFGPDDRFLAIAPMCHGAGMIFSLAPVYFGGHCEIMDKFDAATVVRRLKDGAMTGFFGVPTHFHALMSLDPALLEECRPATLRTVISNAAALPQAMKEKLRGFFRARAAA